MKRDDFAGFFKAVNHGRIPFRWQERLLDHVLEHGRWPDQIAAPTGAGKTSAIDVHIFATALTAANGGPRLPRRLAMVVNRRVLVDDQYARALTLKSTLTSPESGIVAEVAELLASLNGPARNAPALVTARLRGGSVPSRSWRDYPTACAVICGTPDMWGSRLLFRGYGTQDSAAAREAGLLAFDSAVLADEAHLARQLMETARRVSDLAQVAGQPLAGVPPLQVTEVTATPPRNRDPERIVVTVEAEDLTEELLAARLTRPKPVTLLPVADWPRVSAKTADGIANAVAAVHGATGASRTVGCYVNTVPMALAVAEAVRRRSLRVVAVCGQIRPADLARLDRKYEGLLSTKGSGEVDVLVSTQSLEAGVDLDFAGMVTELASGPALAQRAGRVNRLGERGSGPVTVIVPEGPVTEKTRSGPYSWQELNDALDWADTRSKDSAGCGLAPWVLRRFPPPAAEPGRMLYQRPELGDAWHWARTSDKLAAEPDLNLWLSDSLEEETSVGIVVRDAMPSEPADAMAFVRDLPPRRWEVFPVPYRTAQKVLAGLLGGNETLVRTRGGEIDTLRLRPGGEPGIRPGDVVVADSSALIVTRPPDHGFSPPVVVLPSSDDGVDGVDTARHGRAGDVLHYQPGLRRGSVVVRLEWSPDHKEIAGFSRDTAAGVLDGYAGNFEAYTERQRRDLLAGRLGAVADEQWPAGLRSAITEVMVLLGERIEKSDVILRRLDDGGMRVVVLDRRRAVADEDVRQVFTPRDKDQPVLLAEHQEAVGERAGELASMLEVTAGLARALRIAGEHHDDGKADQRFQKSALGADDGGELLAKSRPGKTVRKVREDQGRGCGLPGGWRHEQRSVVDSWAAVHADAGVDPELALRLIGTSHGHGRSGFPHVASELTGSLDPPEWRGLAAELFDFGAWDELIEATQIRYGVWGCAYLEAILRAADCQVSGEGK